MLKSLLLRQEGSDQLAEHFRQEYGGSLRQLLERQPDCSRLAIMGLTPSGALHALLRCVDVWSVCCTTVSICSEQCKHVACVHVCIKAQSLTGRLGGSSSSRVSSSLP